MKPIFKYLCIPALITLPVSSAFADDPIKLPNERLADQNYDYTGKDIIIKWTKDGRPSEPAPIRNAHVTAQNITIEADYPESSNMLNKGIYSDSGNKTDITVTDTISITTYDDGVYTESNGKTNINGFKNLNITSRKGFGLVDNGNGINIEGGDNSVVSIKSEYVAYSFWGWEIHNSRPAIGSHYLSENYGKGIFIKSGMIKLDSEDNYSIYAGNGEKGRFEVNLDASEIDITGTIYGDGGNITITPRADGVVKISPSDKVKTDAFLTCDHPEEVKDNSILLTDGSTLTINKDSAELKQMQITGKINVDGEGSSLLANMTGDSSIAPRKGSSSTVAIEASNGGSVNLNMGGANSSITGDVNAITGTGSSISLNLFEAHQEGNLKAEGNNTLNAVYSGRNSSLTGTADNKGIMNLSFTNQSVMNGDILNGVKVYEDNAPQSSFAGQLTANFDQSSWNGSLSNQGGTAGITLDRGSLWTGNLDNRGGTSGVTLSGGGIWKGDLSNQGGTADVTLHRGSMWTGKASKSGTDAVTNVSVNEGSTWKVTADSTVSTLKLSGGTVDLGGIGIRMNIGHLSPGDGKPGTFHLDLTYHDNQRSTYENAGDSDFLYVGAGTGHSFRVEATENSSINGMRDRDKLYFARTASGVAAFDVNQEVLIRNWDKIYNKALRVETETASVTSVKAKTDAPSLTVTGDNANTATSATSETGDQANAAAPATTAAGAKAKTAAPLMAAASVRARVAAPMAAASAVEDTAESSTTEASAEAGTAASEARTVASENTTAASGDNDDVWYLTPEDTPLDNGFVPNANAYVPGSAHNAAASIWRDNDTLLKRLGELRWSKNNDGAWGRFINRRLARSGTQAFDVSMNTLQLGYDRRIPLSFGDIFVGGAIEHSRGTEKYDDGDGSVYMTDGALYGTFKGRSGDYVDVVTKAGKLFTHYSSDYSDGGDFENWGFSASAEYGHKFDLGWSWSVEPQAQIKYSYLWGDDYTSDNGAKIYQDDMDSLVGRLGLLVAKEFGTGTENPVRIYAKGSVLHEFLGDRNETLYQDVAMHDSTDLAGTWYRAGIGANVGLSENCSFYVDAERDFGTDIKVQYRIQGGFRFEF